jgi:transcriptional regulator of acetoin/glycerol metabolism
VSAEEKLRMDTGSLTKDSIAFDGDDAPVPYLVLVVERLRPLAGGARHSLGNIERVTIGRGPARSAKRLIDGGKRTLSIQVPDPRMSAAHALVERQGDSWVFSDRGSSNGSRVAGAPATTATLRDGDVLELASTFFRFRAAVRTPVAAPGDLDAAGLSGMGAAFGTVLPWLARDLEKLSRVAESAVPVLLLGETGTGKEILARAVHDASGRQGPFVAVNCGALPAGLVESLLFGHKKGAFSGASSDALGFVRSANEGTLFLDEIGDLPKAAQATLLRVLQEREVVPVGEARALPATARIVAATHRPLAALVETGEFRADLLARLAGFTFALPPLRERIDDIGVLLAAILRRIAGERASALTLGAGAARQLLAYAWPSNVRELVQRLEVGLAVAVEDRLDALGDPGPVQEKALPAAARRLSPESEDLRQRVAASLSEHGGNVTHVGEAMGTSRTQVQRWLKRFGLDPRAYRK